MADTIARYRVIGTTDDVTECDKCGREELKSTVVLSVLDDDGNDDGTLYVGSDCAARITKWTRKRITDDAKTADKAAAEAVYAERLARWQADRPARVAEFEAFKAWLMRTFGTAQILAVSPVTGEKLRWPVVDAAYRGEFGTGTPSCGVSDPVDDDAFMPRDY